MTKNQFYNIADRLDRDKFTIFGNDIAFNLTLFERHSGNHRQIGIGTAEDMSILILIELQNALRSARGAVTPEDFIDSVKESFLRFNRENPEMGGEINVFDAEEGE